MGTSLGRYLEDVASGKSVDELNSARKLNAVVDTASNTPQKRAARELAIQARTGMPLDFVSRNLDALETEAKKADFDPIKFQKDSPLVASWISQNANHMALLDDDDRYRLTSLESLVRELGKGAGLGLSTLPAGIGGVLETVGETMRDNPERLPLVGQVARDFGAGTFAEYSGSALRRGTKSVTAGITPRVASYADVETAGDLRDYLAYSLGQGIGSMAAVVGGSVVAGPAGGAAVGGVMAFGDVRDELEELDPEMSAGARNALALGLAIPIAALDRVAPGQIAAKLLARGATKEVVTEAAKYGLTKRVALELLKGGATESATEVGQESIQYVGTRAATGRPMSGGEFGERAINAGVGGFLGGSTMSGATAVFDALDEATRDSKLSQVSPEKLEEVIHHITTDGPLKDVYAPIEKWVEFYQSVGLDPAVEAERILGSRSAYDDAVASGEDLVIPTSRYAVHVPTEHKKYWKSELRTSAMASSEREATEAVAAVDTETTTEPTEADPVVESARLVGEDVTQQLIATGMDEGTARANASVYEAAFRALGQRMGMDPMALYRRYNPAINKVEDQVRPIGARVGPEDVAKRVRELGTSPVVDAPNVQQFNQASDDVNDYGIAHRPPDPKGGAPLHDLTRDIYPDDVYGPNAVRYYGTGEDALDASSFSIVQRMRGNPKGLVTIYRAVAGDITVADKIERIERHKAIILKRGKLPPDVETQLSPNAYFNQIAAELDKLRSEPIPDEKPVAINSGDWVTINKQYAKQHGESALRGNYKIISRKVRAEQLYTDGNSIHEFGYWDNPDPTAAEYEQRALRLNPAVTARDQFLAWVTAAEDPRLSDELRAYANQRADALQAAAKAEFDATLASGERPKGAPKNRKEWLEYAQSVNPQVETPAFRNWFGDSKVVDEQGNPLVVYHGTSDSVSEFDLEHPNRRDTGWLGTGVYASSSSAIASDYSLLKSGSSGPNVMPLYARLQNPYYATLADKQRLQLISHNKGKDAGREAADQWTRELKEKGHDGVILVYDKKDVGSANASQEIVVFDPVGVKSATGNRGTFDPASPSILHQEVPQTPEELEAAVSRTLNEASPRGELRGRIRISPTTGQVQIDLFKAKNLSTFLHETGHFYLHILGDLASLPDAPVDVIADYQTIVTALGGTAGQPFTTEQHEQFARMFESYLMSGKAPSTALQDAFMRFKAWLTDIYAVVRNLNAPVSPEIAAVFDRLLASQEEIADAERLISKPIDLKALGVPADQIAKVEAVRSRVREAAQSSLASKLIAIFRRESTKVWLAKRAKIREQVAQEVNEERDTMARTLLTTGKKPDGTEWPDGVAFKLDRAALVAEYPHIDLKSLPRGSYAREGGIHPEEAAEHLGYDSADEMIRAVMAAQPAKQRIEQLTDERMKEEEGEDLLTSAELPVEAMKAVHDEKRSELLRMEAETLAAAHFATFKTLVRAARKRLPSNEQVKEQARLIIGGKKVSEINQLLYQRAQKKAADAAAEAVLRGDLDRALAEKQKELLNHELYIAAVAAKAEADAVKAQAAKLFRPDEKMAKGRDMDYVNAARAIAAAFGLGKTDKTPAEYLSGIQKYDPDTYNAVMAKIADALEGAVPFRDATVEQMRAFKSALDTLDNNAMRNQQVLINGKIEQREVIQLTLADRLREIGTTGGLPGRKGDITPWQDAKVTLMGLSAMLRRVESWVDAMDGGNPDGIFRRYIWTPISEGVTAFRVAKKSTLEKYLEIAKLVEPSIKAHKGQINATEIDYKFKDKTTLIGALLHTGNASNLDKLLRGYGWSAVGWDAFLARMAKEGVLTKADYDYVQAVWDLFESLKPDAQRSHHAMYGYYFDEITAQEVITPFGTYKGGYVPARADPNKVNDADRREAQAIIEGDDNSFMFPTTGRGFTKGRTKGYAAPLTLELSMVPSHIDAVLRFTHIEPRVKDIGRIVTNKELRDVLDRFDPTIADNMLVPWLQRAARQTKEVRSTFKGGRTVDNIARALRTRSGLSIMFANVTNALQQFTGLSLAAVKVKPKHLRNAMWRYLRDHKATLEAVQSKSPFMNTRMTMQASVIQGHIDDLLLNPSKYDELRAFAEKHGYFLQAGTQNVVDIITWMGAYDQAVAGGASEQDAVRQGDAAVRMTQGSFAPEDVSRFETGAPVMQLFSMFYSYFNMQANLLGSEFIATTREMGLKKGAGRMLYVYTLGFAIPAFVSELIVRAMAGEGLDDDDDDQYMDDVLALFWGAHWKTATAFVPVVGQAAVAITNRFNNKWYDDRLNTSPAVTTLERAFGAPKSVYKAIAEDGSKKTASRDLLTALQLLTGLPTAAFAKPIGYGIDLQEGNADPDGPLDMARGFVTGRTGTR